MRKRINTNNVVIYINFNFFLYTMKSSIKIVNNSRNPAPDIDSAELFTFSFIRLHFTVSQSSHPDFAFISNEGLFLLYLLRVISTTG